jgi:hypothetical protein
MYIVQVCTTDVREGILALKAFICIYMHEYIQISRSQCNVCCENIIFLDFILSAIGIIINHYFAVAFYSWILE